jgi:hypothetical protein
LNKKIAGPLLRRASDGVRQVVLMNDLPNALTKTLRTMVKRVDTDYQRAAASLGLANDDALVFVRKPNVTPSKR